MKRSRSGSSHKRLRIAAGMLLVLTFIIAALQALGALTRLNNTALDITQRLVRAWTPRVAVEQVVIVGVDEGSERRFPEPFALWHRHLGALLSAIAQGQPRLVALDIVLPERSYDQLSPGLDAELIRGLIAAKRAGGLVIGMRLDSHGHPQRIDDLVLAAAGEEAIGLAYAPIDVDGTARRLNSSSASASRTALPLLVERAAQTLGIEPRGGIIDFACGQMFQYIPMQDVLDWASTDPQRLRVLTGRSVFIGKVGPDDDPMRQPLSLAAWDPAASEPPGVVLLAQTLRALESGRMLPTLPAVLQIALVMLCACIVLIEGLWRTWSAAAAMIAAVLAAVYAAYVGGLFIPPAAPLLAVVLGATARSSFEAFEQRRSRLAIERQFGGYVSPSVLQAILAGEIDPSQPRKYANLAFLFADLRGFTPLTEAQPAEEVLTLLNRYYDAITPAIHQHEGTIDNFRGDGILAIFGAPRAADDAPRRAVLAAIEMLDRLEVLNQQLMREGRSRLRMGIGLAAGGAMAGNIGTLSRHNYSVVGDSVNVAARLQSMCKSMRMCIIAAEPIQRAGADVLNFVPLGKVELAGHAPVAAYGVPERESITPTEPKIHLGESDSAA